jgi:hypothetical protein
LEVKQGEEPFVDFVKIAGELSPIVGANRPSSLVRRFVDHCQVTNRANWVAIVNYACFAGMQHALFLCTAALPGYYLREMKVMKILKRNFLWELNGLSVHNWVRRPILEPQLIQFVHQATHFGRTFGTRTAVAYKTTGD